MYPLYTVQPEISRCFFRSAAAILASELEELGHGASKRT